jgi:3-hydroxymyristoyl/3-hydroxydecanoyl-(acyl carrier protein) dehydratase
MHSETTLHIAPDHPAFAGHFPGAPIVPGVVLLDAAVRAALERLRPAANGLQEGCVELVCQISSAKFLSPVGPGDTLTLRLETTAAGAVRFEISSAGRKVAMGTLVLPPP